MRLKFFWIPTRDSGAVERELNEFLTGHRVVRMERQLISGQGEPAGWAICIEWLPNSASAPVTSETRTEKLDYREILDAESFKIFSALRTWRKETAAGASIPVYTVATNEQLAAIARGRIQTRSALETVEGFGTSRLERFADSLLAACQKEMAVLATAVSPTP